VSRELLDWQHLDKVNNRYNFVISRHRQSREIHAILGFLQTSHFDSNIQHPHTWMCIWKKRDDIVARGIGVGLCHFLVNNVDVERISTLGISESTLGIYKEWNYTAGKFSHFFMLNIAVDDYKLIDGYASLKKPMLPVSINCCTMEICMESDFMTLDKRLFTFFSKHKSMAYYISRFYRHPLYSYNAYSIRKRGEIHAVIFLRECSHDGSRALRIVDYVGDLQALTGNADNFQKLLSERSAEYIDFLHVGLDASVLESGGFTDKSNTDLVVPNYFEPFCMENIELDYVFKSVDDRENAVFFKADSDQDRPNLL
jgi:hypothetical protein